MDRFDFLFSKKRKKEKQSEQPVIQIEEYPLLPPTKEPEPEKKPIIIEIL